MNSAIQTVFCIFLATLHLSCQTPELKDNFSSGNIAPFWRSDTHTGSSIPHAKVTQEKAFPPSNYSLKFVVKSGDSFTKGDLRERNERSEIYLDQKNNVDLPNKEVWYSFNLLVPEDFPITPTRLVMGQWKEVEEETHSESPIVSNRYQKGKFFIKIKVLGKEKSFPIDNPKKGIWNKLVYRFIFAKENGELEVWNNNQRVASYSGPTLNNEVPVYFKCCLYRDHFEKDMVVYFADFQKSNKKIQ